MTLLRVHATIRQQSNQMQTTSTHARVLHRLEQRRVLEELTAGNRSIDARDVHAHHATRAQVQMPHLRVPHLPIGQADEMLTRANQRVWILA